MKRPFTVAWHAPGQQRLTLAELMCRQELIAFLRTKPWADKSRRYHWSRKEEYVNGLKGILGVWCVSNCSPA